jgi:hypothetical protein
LIAIEVIDPHDQTKSVTTGDSDDDSDGNKGSFCRPAAAKLLQNANLTSREGTRRSPKLRQKASYFQIDGKW